MNFKVEGAINKLMKHAVRNDGFRVYFYPNLPKNYKINLSVIHEAHNLARNGLNSSAIARQIIQDEINTR